MGCQTQRAIQDVTAAMVQSTRPTPTSAVIQEHLTKPEKVKTRCARTQRGALGRYKTDACICPCHIHRKLFQRQSCGDLICPLYFSVNSSAFMIVWLLHLLV